MAANKVTDRKAVSGILAEAAQRNQSLDLVRRLDSGDDACRSRFVETPDEQLAVEVPSRQGHLIPVRRGEDVEVYFRLKHLRYWFAGKVESRSSVTLSGGLTLPMLVLTRPRALELRQRRKHFRVGLGAAAQLMASLWHVPEPDAETAAAALPQMEVLDLSAGGMRMLYPHGEGCPVDVEAALTVALPLRSEAPPVRLSARVARVARVPASVTHVAVVFTGLDESPEGKMTRDRLAHFVAEREREELRRMHDASRNRP